MLMKKRILYLMVCSVFLMTACSKQEKIVEKDYTKFSYELTELLNTTKPYSYYHVWSNADVIVTNESLTIQDRYWKTPDIQIVEKDGKAHIVVHFESENEFGYTKNNEQKKAVLSTSYDVNSDLEDRLLICSLSVNGGKDIYQFYYDSELNCIYEYNETIKEELVFAKNLQNSILYFCGGEYASFERRLSQTKDVASLLVEKLGYQEVEWTEFPEPVRYEYAFMDKSENYEAVFEDFNPDFIYPIYSMNPKKEFQNLFVVEKDGLYGVINDKGWLVVPFVATDLPMEFDTHIHYMAESYEKGYYGQYLPYTRYYTCSGEHGHAPEEYALIDGQSTVQAIYYADEGPGSWNELDENELNGKLNTYELVIAHPLPEDDPWIEDFRYEHTQKYGVFSDEGVVTEAVYENSLFMTADLAAVKKNGKWGYVDASGKEVIPCIYDTVVDNGYYEYVYPAKDGYVVVKNDKGLYGVLDYSGNMLIPFNYQAASPYLNGTVLLKKNNEWVQADPFTASYTSMNFPLIEKSSS